MISVCTVCGAYSHRRCEWDGEDDPPCEHHDTFVEEDDCDRVDPDILREDRDERARIAKKDDER
jgi:hypothetical protein